VYNDPILMMKLLKGPFIHAESDKQMLLKQCLLLLKLSLKGIGNPIYESMNLEIDEVAL
jgi:hypothetical protein